MSYDKLLIILLTPNLVIIILLFYMLYDDILNTCNCICKQFSDSLSFMLSVVKCHASLYDYFFIQTTIQKATSNFTGTYNREKQHVDQ